MCLDVINQTWSPMFDLVNIFEIFLPQLLLYPNPTDPLNGDAAALLLANPTRTPRKVRELVGQHARPEDLVQKRGTERAGEQRGGRGERRRHGGGRLHIER